MIQGRRRLSGSDPNPVTAESRHGPNNVNTHARATSDTAPDPPLLNPDP